MRLFPLLLGAISVTVPVYSGPPCTIKTIAGPGTFFGGDGGPATKALFYNIGGFRFDPSGNLFIADTNNHRVRKVAADGIVTTFAGNGIPGSAGDGGPATSAQLDAPIAVALDAAGNLYIADQNANRIRKIDAGGTITTLAGSGVAGFSGDGGLATAAKLQNPGDLAVTSDGSVVILDTNNYRVRKVSPQGLITTLAGTGKNGFGLVNTEGGPATLWSFHGLRGLAARPDGEVLIADSDTVQRVAVDGTIQTFAVSETAQTNFDFIYGIALDSKGNLAIATTSAIRLVSQSGVISTPAFPAGSNHALGFDGKDALYGTDGIAIYNRSSPAVFAGGNILGVSGDGGPAAAALFGYPSGIAADASGNVYVADEYNYRIRKIAPDGTISTFAGNGYFGRVSTPTPASSAPLPYITSMAFDSAGDLYLSAVPEVYKIDTSGMLSLLTTFGGRPGPSTIAVAADGSLYVLNNEALWRVTPDGFAQQQTSASALAADSKGTVCFMRGNQLFRIGSNAAVATLAEFPAFQNPLNSTLAIDRSGNVWVSFDDPYFGSLLQEVKPDGTVVTVARQSYSLPFMDGPAPSVSLGFPLQSTVDAAGNFYFTDAYQNNVRELTAGCNISPRPLIANRGIVNAASSDPTAAPGELMSLYGSGLGPAVGAVATLTPKGYFPTTLSGVQVTVNGIAAPLLYVSQNQINFVVPYEVADLQSFPLQVTYNGILSDTANLGNYFVDLGVFAIANPDGTRNSATNPAKSGSYVVIYGTGQGAMNPPIADGALASATTLSYPVLPISASINQQYVPVAYAGSAPGLVAGVLQVNLALPASLPAGLNFLTLSSGGRLLPQVDFYVAP